MRDRRGPGTYRFVDKDGRVLYVGKADRLRERVRSYFAVGADHARKVRQAVRLVERIDWDETYTPLEAVVQESSRSWSTGPRATCMAADPRTMHTSSQGALG